jgi:hypothetical protein
MKKCAKALLSIALLVLCALFVSPVLAIADDSYQPGWSKWRPSFGIWVLDPDDNSALRLGNWLYDEELCTYVDAETGEEPIFERFDGQQRSLVTDFSASPLFYTGVDHYYAARVGVVERGILAEDVIAYYNASNGELPDIEFDNYGDFTVTYGASASANDDPWYSNDRAHPGKYTWVGWDDSITGLTRYFYPDFVIGVNNWPGNPQGHRLKELGDGIERPTLLAVTSYNDRITRLTPNIPQLSDGVIDDASELAVMQDYLVSVADTERALRCFTGMLPDNSTMPLGSTTEGAYYVGSIWITLPSDGVAGGLAEEDSGPDESGVGLPSSGDLNGDGEVTVSEALATARAIINGIAGTGLNDAQVAALDMDGDGRLTMADVVLSLRRALGL